jgi:hypothetical protein
MPRQQAEASQSDTPLLIKTLHHRRLGCAAATEDFLANSIELSDAGKM